MRKNSFKKINKILYSVDPTRLCVTEFDVTRASRQEDTTTTYECFSMRREKTSFTIADDKFPYLFNGIYYFKTEDEAVNFIKMQIGM